MSEETKLKVGKRYKLFGNYVTLVYVGKTEVAYEYESGEISTWTIENFKEHSNIYDERLEWKLDDLLVVWDCVGEEHLRYFAGLQNGKVFVFVDGKTSKAVLDTCRWEHARLATPEDIERLIPKRESWWAEPRNT